MVERAAVDRFLDTLRTARAARDLDTIAGLFDDEVQFAIVGLGSPVIGKAAVLETIGRLIDAFEFLEWTPIQTFISGEDVTVRHRLKVRHRPSGQVAETETAEFLSMRNGRCHAFTQFADTALVARLAAG